MIGTQNRRQRRLMAHRGSKINKQKQNEDHQYAAHWGLPVGVRVDPCWLAVHHPKGKKYRAPAPSAGT